MSLYIVVTVLCIHISLVPCIMYHRFRIFQCLSYITLIVAIIHHQYPIYSVDPELLFFFVCFVCFLVQSGIEEGPKSWSWSHWRKRWRELCEKRTPGMCEGDVQLMPVRYGMKKMVDKY